MGNRAVITTKKNFENNGVGVYLHWNGGYDSVSAFLKYCELKGYRSPDGDCYGWARLCQVIGNYFGGTLSLGIDVVDQLDCDNYDNGTYIIEGWNIVGREHYEGAEQNSYDLMEMLVEIDNAQPEKERLGDFITAAEVPTSDLKIGDVVYMSEYEGSYGKYKVVGFGDGRANGSDVTGIPYVERYGDAVRGYAWNINNYINTKTVKVV